MKLIIDERDKYQNNIIGVQYVLLNILKIIVKICDENNIIYWVDSGTLLGAVRHKGFIPWDDDIDICVPRSEIEKLKKILLKKLPNHLFYQDSITDKGIYNEIIRIRDRFSKTENIVTEYHNGISIDIFPMDEIKQSIFHKGIELLLKLTRDKNRVISKKRKIFYLLKKYSFLDREKLTEKLYTYFSKKEEKNDSYIYMKGLWWKIFERKDIYPLQDIIFEDFVVKAPANTHNYLKTLYGNYMELPPLNKRQIHHNLNEVSLIKKCNHKESLDWKKEV